MTLDSKRRGQERGQERGGGHTLSTVVAMVAVWYRYALYWLMNYALRSNIGALCVGLKRIWRLDMESRVGEWYVVVVAETDREF